MKLAEALSIRKDLQKRIQQLGQRIQNNVKVQEGDTPSEDPTELMKELDACLTQLEDLIWRINATNMKTTNAQGVTLTQLMARKDVLTMRVNNLRSIFETASATMLSILSALPSAHTRAVFPPSCFMTRRSILPSF